MSLTRFFLKLMKNANRPEFNKIDKNSEKIREMGYKWEYIRMQRRSLKGIKGKFTMGYKEGKEHLERNRLFCARARAKVVRPTLMINLHVVLSTGGCI